MKLSLSTYWKYQIMGWGIASLTIFASNLIGNPYGFAGFLRINIFTALFGLIATHILRDIIKKGKIFDKSLIRQVIYIALLGVSLSFIASILIVWALEITGIRATNAPPKFKIPPVFQFFILRYYEVGRLVTAWTAIYFFVQYRRKIKRTEYEKASLKIEVLESEARALRAQMNPHFIFNCLNSIKSLINKNENEKAANYLTTFSRLILTLFHNSGQREVSLYEELETCKLYTQLEKMRFGNKVSFVFDVDGSLDLKDFKIPALIVQPFIENAIWHGLVPKDSGGEVIISVKANKDILQCIVDDNGIGRELSRKYAPEYGSNYQSKGIKLTQSRLELDRILNGRGNIIEIIDKKDITNLSSGTKVIMTFKELS